MLNNKVLDSSSDSHHENISALNSVRVGDDLISLDKQPES